MLRKNYLYMILYFLAFFAITIIAVVIYMLIYRSNVYQGYELIYRITHFIWEYRELFVFVYIAAGIAAIMYITLRRPYIQMTELLTAAKQLASTDENQEIAIESEEIELVFTKIRSCHESLNSSIDLTLQGQHKVVVRDLDLPLQRKLLKHIMAEFQQRVPTKKSALFWTFKPRIKQMKILFYQRSKIRKCERLAC